MSNTVIGLLGAAGALFFGLIASGWLAGSPEPSDATGDPSAPDVFDGSAGAGDDGGGDGGGGD